MTDFDEFDKADKEAGATEESEVALEAPEPIKGDPPAEESQAVVVRPETLPRAEFPSDFVEFRKQLIREYHGGAESILERMDKKGVTDLDGMLKELMDELITETDNLLGNQLVATQNGELRDSSVMSVKRSDVLASAIKYLREKQDEDRSRGVNLDSKEMLEVIRYFIGKAKDAFDQMGVGDEMKDLFLNTFSEMMEPWRKDLKERFAELEPQG